MYRLVIECSGQSVCLGLFTEGDFWTFASRLLEVGWTRRGWYFSNGDVRLYLFAELV